MDSKQIKSDIVAVVESLTDDELRQILALERELFPESLQDIDYEKDLKDTLAVLAYDPDGNVAGYVICVPHEAVYGEFLGFDPLMPESSGALYLESIAIRRDLQGYGYFSKLVRKLIEAANGRAITMHARVSNITAASECKSTARSICTA